MAFAGWGWRRLVLVAGCGCGRCILPPLVARMHAEERLLRSQFGSQYEAYCARTQRLIPGIY
jgi:protein-S-isoprenylcysteine O-methyltransferase Ste14